MILRETLFLVGIIQQRTLFNGESYYLINISVPDYQGETLKDLIREIVSLPTANPVE